MNPETLLILPILIPVIFAIVALPFFRKQASSAAVLVLIAVVLSFGSFLLIEGSSAQLVHPWVDNISLNFSMTGWKALLIGFAFVFQLMTCLHLLTSLRRIAKPFLFAFSILLAFAATAGVILTDNVMVLLIFWEIFLVALYGAIHSGGDASEAVARKALIIGGASDFLMILGLMLFFIIGGRPEMTGMISTGSSFTALISFILLFLGAGAKAGMFPFHTWIPDAAEAMPAQGFAAMPASLEKILGISFLFTITHSMFIMNDTVRLIMYLFAAATIFVSIIPAFIEKDLKRVLALTAIMPAGFMIAGMATSEAAGMAGALMLMLTHATYKSTMFLSAANFEERAGGTSLEKLEGIGRIMPYTALGFVFAFLAAISLPPTGGFLAKEMIFEGLIAGGHMVMFAVLWIGATLSVAVFCKIIAVLWAGNAQVERSEAPATQTLPVLILGLASLAGGVIFFAVKGIFGRIIVFDDPYWLSAAYHPSPLAVASLGVYLFGALLYFLAREKSVTASATFNQMGESPVLGTALRMAREKKFDGYEIGVKVLEWLAGIVFRYVERLIDLVADGLIAFGRWLFQPLLSSIHNGVYCNYLGWVIAGLAAVLFFLFGTSHI